MFQEAKLKNPIFLEWLDEPESLIKHSQNQVKTVSMEAFSDYHTQVVNTIRQLES
jgi:hypothetical protein